MITQVKDIGDEDIYQAILSAKALNETRGTLPVIWPYDIIDAPEKVVLAKMDKMADQEKLNYGVSLRTAWIEEYPDYIKERSKS